MIPSAAGERQMFPRQTKSILIFSLFFKELISAIFLWFTLWFTIFIFLIDEVARLVYKHKVNEINPKFDIDG